MKLSMKQIYIGLGVVVTLGSLATAGYLLVEDYIEDSIDQRYEQKKAADARTNPQAQTQATGTQPSGNATNWKVDNIFEGIPPARTVPPEQAKPQSDGSWTVQQDYVDQAFRQLGPARPASQ